MCYTSTRSPLFRYIALFLLMLWSHTHELRAQDPQFTQFYATSIYLNPAFAGATQNARAIAVYRNQWPSLEANYQTTAAIYDHYLRDYNSGFGIMLKNDQQGANISSPIESNEASLVYSYHFMVRKNLAVSLGIQAGFVSRNLNYNNFFFASQFNASRNSFDQSIASGENFGTERKNFFDAGSGVLLYNNNFWFGASFHHINEPNQSFGGVDDPLPMKYSLHGGYKIAFYDQKRKTAKERSITPTFHYKAQGKSDQFSLGAYGVIEPLLLGFWYRGLPIKRLESSIANHDAVALLTGIRTKNFMLGYSYDITISGLSGYSNGAHEITLTYDLQVNHNRSRTPKYSKYSPLYCPNPWTRYDNVSSKVKTKKGPKRRKRKKYSRKFRRRR